MINPIQMPDYLLECVSSIETEIKNESIKKQTWRNNITPISYEPINEILSAIFLNKEDENAFKDYIINILDNKPNNYGVLIIPGFETGDILLDILRELGDFYNRYTNPRNAKERLIRHDGDNSINVIEKNQNCHHVYLWCKNTTNIKSSYDKNKIKYTVLDIKNENGLMDKYRRYKISCGYKNKFIFSMLNDYLG